MSQDKTSISPPPALFLTQDTHLARKHRRTDGLIKTTQLTHPVLLKVQVWKQQLFQCFSLCNMQILHHVHKIVLTNVRVMAVVGVSGCLAVFWSLQNIAEQPERPTATIRSPLWKPLRTQMWEFSSVVRSVFAISQARRQNQFLILTHKDKICRHNCLN